MERRKCLVKSLKNELWNFMVDTHAIADRLPNMTFCGPARDTVLTNRQTEKLNFDTNYITIIIYLLRPRETVCFVDPRPPLVPVNKCFVI
jgi:hypothetical protein